MLTLVGSPRAKATGATNYHVVEADCPPGLRLLLLARARGGACPELRLTGNGLRLDDSFRLARSCALAMASHGREPNGGPGIPRHASTAAYRYRVLPPAAEAP